MVNMVSEKLLELAHGIESGELVPYLGPGILKGVIGINRDTQLQDSYRDRSHTLIRGISRVGGTDHRFRIHHYDGGTYTEIEQEAVDRTLPVLFKPMGSPRPDSTYIASDADYVDYITELMGCFAIPDFLKCYRHNRHDDLLKATDSTGTPLRRTAAKR